MSLTREQDHQQTSDPKMFTYWSDDVVLQLWHVSTALSPDVDSIDHMMELVIGSQDQCLNPKTDVPTVS